MGKVTVKAFLQNYEDEISAKKGIFSSDQVRHLELNMIVDTGARAIGLPLSIIQKLGLEEKKQVTITLSDGSTQNRPLFEGLRLRIGDRDDIFSCIGKPEGAPCIIGQIVLEDLDLVVDCPNQRIIPNPEAPTGMMLFDDF